MASCLQSSPGATGGFTADPQITTGVLGPATARKVAASQALKTR
jgi:hypothetical protein